MEAPPTADPCSAEELLAHAGRVRALARKLLGDDSLAEDVTQQTYLKALERPPRHPGAMGGWLLTVARHLSIQRLRRRRPESHAAAEHLVSPESAADTAARLETLQHLAAVLEALPEPYRTAVTWRFLDELRPQEIADRFGVPATNARTWIQRGLQMMRARLEEREGPKWRHRCRYLFLPGPMVSTGSASPPWLAAALGHRWGIVIACLFATVLFVLIRPEPPRSPDQAGPPTAAAPAGEDNAGAAASGMSAWERRTSLPMVEDAADEVSLSQPSVWLPFSGWAYLGRKPVEGARVRVHGEERHWVSRTAADGSFAFSAVPFPDDPTLGLLLEVDSPVGWFGRQVGRDQVPVRIDLAPKGEVEVQVRDRTTGRALEGASVGVHLLNEFSRSDAFATELVPDFEATTDSTGKALFSAIPVDFLVVTADCPGYRRGNTWTPFGRVPEQDRTLYRLDLEAESGRSIRLFDGDGNRVPAGLEVFYCGGASQTWSRASTAHRGEVSPNGPFDFDRPSLAVRLANGRIWAQLAGPKPTSDPGGVQVRLIDPKVSARLEAEELPESAWVEARRYPRQRGWSNSWHLEVLPETKELGWTRLDPSGPVELGTGWTGEDLAVQARLQPSGFVLGIFPVEEEMATVRLPKLSSVSLVLETDDRASRPWSLRLDHGSMARGRITLLMRPEVERQVILPAGHYRTFLTHPDGRARTATPTTIELKSAIELVVLRPQEYRELRITCTLDGEAVRGGRLHALFLPVPDGDQSIQQGSDGPLSPLGEGTILVPSRGLIPVCTSGWLWPGDGWRSPESDRIISGFSTWTWISAEEKEGQVHLRSVPCVIRRADGSPAEAEWRIRPEALFEDPWSGVIRGSGTTGEWANTSARGSVVSSVASPRIPPGQDSVSFRLVEGWWVIQAQNGRDAVELTPKGGLQVLPGAELSFTLPLESTGPEEPEEEQDQGGYLRNLERRPGGKRGG